MSYRPWGWRNPTLELPFVRRRSESIVAFEAGADAMLEALYQYFEKDCIDTYFAEGVIVNKYKWLEVFHSLRGE